MDVIFSSLAAILLYLVAALLQWREFNRRADRLAPLVLAVGCLALTCHALSLASSLLGTNSFELGFFKVSSLIFLIICAAALLSMLRRPLQNLLVILFPLSALSIVIALLAPPTGAGVGRPGPGMLVHIGLSISAYAVLSIATLQALALALLDTRLKHHRTVGLVQLLPPLQLMETMLFELIWLGVVLLAASIASGFVFLDDIFAQHLVHKTTLTIAALVTFSILLWGHHRRGWRAKTAVHWTLGGFVVLMLGYYGSKFVLELILNNP
jgi:ABC-type uncharacterized transport system permease subunit